MKKSLGFNDANDLRKSINKYIQSKKSGENQKTRELTYVEENIYIKPIDYYYTNSIARSSKVMNECRQIFKTILIHGN